MAAVSSAAAKFRFDLQIEECARSNGKQSQKPSYDPLMQELSATAKASRSAPVKEFIEELVELSEEALHANQTYEGLKPLLAYYSTPDTVLDDVQLDIKVLLIEIEILQKNKSDRIRKQNALRLKFSQLSGTLDQKVALKCAALFKAIADSLKFYYTDQEILSSLKTSFLQMLREPMEKSSLEQEDSSVGSGSQILLPRKKSEDCSRCAIL